MMRGAGMAAAYGAGAAVFGYLAFRAGFWIFDRGAGVWFRWQDNKQSKENKP